MTSKPEKIAAEALIPLQFVHYSNVLLPYSFIDKEGATFNAMADFYHPDLDLYVEIKDKTMNSKTSKSTSDKAIARVDQARYKKSPTHYQIKNGWNHAASKHGIVQEKVGNAQYAVVFTGKPDAATLKLLKKHRVAAYSLKYFCDLIRMQLN